MVWSAFHTFPQSWRHQGNKSWECQESNPRLLVEKRKRCLFALPPITITFNFYSINNLPSFKIIRTCSSFIFVYSIISCQAKVAFCLQCSSRPWFFSADTKKISFPDFSDETKTLLRTKQLGLDCKWCSTVAAAKMFARATPFSRMTFSLCDIKVRD